MKPKIGGDKGAVFILGIVYTLLGAIFVVVDGVLTAVLYEEEARMVGIIFASIGSVFLILGIVLLIIQNRKKQTAQRLVDSGKYLWAEVIELAPNYNVRVNNRNPYIARARYVDGNGTVHIFKSNHLYGYVDDSVLHQQVKVYIEDNSFKKYYMDIDSILPKVEEH